jgi:purine nucleosidase
VSARPVLVDTDIGSDVDDALALALALAARESLEIVAVTTVGRGGPVRARVAAALLGLAGRTDLEVCAGETRPLLRPEHSFNWFDHEPRCIADAPLAKIGSEAAPERIARAAREHAGLELVAVGPLTNLARALALDPELPRRVAGVTIMGGHVREARIGAHVCAPGIDYNLCSDPEASLAVLGAGFRIRLVTADVTLSTWLRESDLPRLERAGALGRELVRQVRIWAPEQRRIFTGIGGTLAGDNVAFLHDPLTLLALIDPAPLRFEELRIATTIESGVLRTHEVDARVGIGMPMLVATAVDAAAAERAIVSRLANGG